MAAATAIAQTATAPAAQARAQRRQELMQSLNLTAAQQQQAKTIRQNTRQQAQPLIEQLRQDRQSLAAAVKADNSGQIQQLSAAMGTLRGQVLAVRSAGMAQFYALLTPDQRAKADAFHHESHKGE